MLDCFCSPKSRNGPSRDSLTPESVHFGAIPVLANEPPFIVADVRRLANEVVW